MIKNTFEGILAGIMISIGGAVYVAAADKVVGAIFFSVALLTICFKGYSLYTGRVGYIVLSHTKSDVSSLFLGLLGNFVATLLCGVLVAYAIPALHESAEVMAAAKLAQPALSTLIRGFFCGVLMYAAVSIYRENKSPLGVLFCVPTFILAGFEHSIADMFYLALGHAFNFDALIFILLVVIGNSLGAMAMTGLRLLGEKTVKNT